MREQWKDIVGYEGLYQISNLGRVRSCDRYISQDGRWGKYKRFYQAKILTPTDNGNGYLIISFKKEGKRRNYYIHRLVASHFIAMLDNTSLVVNHKDYDRKNNQVSNLEWITQAENVAYSICHMSKPRNVCKPTNTGHKYISQRNGRYRLNIQGKIDKTFASLEEAVLRKEVVLSG